MIVVPIGIHVVIGALAMESENLASHLEKIGVPTKIQLLQNAALIS